MADEQSKSGKDVWDKISTLSGIVAAVFVPVAIALVGNWYSTALKDRETTLSEETFKRDWVQLGLSILRDANTKDNMRQWAIKIINSYSSQRLPESVVDDFVNGGAILPPATQAPSTTNSQSAATITPPGPTETPVGATDRVGSMDTLQTRAIRALLDRDLPGAVAAYDLAFKSWPTFRNVDEIHNFLLTPPSTQTDQDWKNLYRRMQKFDLRGVSQEVRNRLKASAG